MFLARMFCGQNPQVYALAVSYSPRTWRFCSYRLGAAAIAQTRTQAVAAARQELTVQSGCNCGGGHMLPDHSSHLRGCPART